MTQITLINEVYIQWRLYEAAQTLAVKGSLGNWAGFISLGIPSLSFVRGKSPPDFAFYIKRLGRTILLHLRAPESCRNSKFFHFHEPRMLPELWASQMRQRKQRPKIFLSFNRARKRTLLLRLGTVASADCIRSLMSLQMLIKNVQELAKEEGEESEAKLREAIEILEGATSTIPSSWRDFWRMTF